MRFSTVFAASASIFGLASAIIQGIEAPSTIAPGSSFTVKLLTYNYIQAVYDVSAAVGIASGSGYPESLGTVLNSVYIGPSQSNILTNISIPVTMPATQAKGQALLNVAVTSLYGAVANPTLTDFNVTVTVGEDTSADVVRSGGSYSVSL